MRVFLGAALLLAVPIFAAGPLRAQDGLDSWDRIYAAASHPRCTNCHVGAQGRPMWEGLDYGSGAVHGMNVLAGDSRIGAETIPCRTCHITADAVNDVPHAAPQIDDAWRLPPVELEWLDKSSAALCMRLRNPETNNGNSVAELADHVLVSAFVSWGYAPGGGRSAPGGTVQDLARDLLEWEAAGAPCRTE